MKRILAAALLILALAAGARAQTPSPDASPSPSPARKLVVLAVPMKETGDYQPLTQDQVRQAFEQAVEQAAPSVDVVWSSQPAEDSLTSSQASALGQDAKADMVTWGRLSFQHTTNNVPQSYGSQVYVTEIQVTGSAHLTVFDVGKGVMFSDRTYPFFSTTRTAAVEGSDAFAKAEDEVALQFVQQISGYLVKAIRNQLLHSQ